jgi:flagellar basal body-associated protein FliL
MLTVKEINMVLKNNSNKHARTILISVIAGIVVIAAGLVVYFAYFANHPKTTEPSPQYPVTQSDSNNGTPSKNVDYGKGSSGDTTNTGSDTTTTSNQVPVANSGTITITTLNQTSGYVNAQAVVSGFSTTQCVYSFAAPQAKPVVRQINGNCSGISIPESEFEFIGTYTLTVTAYNGTSEKISASKDIAVQ